MLPVDIGLFLTFLSFSTPGSVFSTAHGNLGCCKCEFSDTAFMNEACGSISSFMTTLQLLMMARCDITEPCRRLGKDKVSSNEWYDFIVVGAGVAGPVIAKRLSDNPKWRVLLIEAGPEEPSLTAIPGLAFNSINTSLDWKYKTEPTQPYPTACLENGGVCNWPRGKMVSGTGGMYGMMYVRGHPWVYDTWASKGNPGWSYSEIKKYFERAENPEKDRMVDDTVRNSNSHRNPLHIKYFSHQPEFVQDLVRAAAEMGYNTRPLVGHNQTGFMVAPMIVKDGLRGTTSRFYLDNARPKENLHVLTNCHVTKLIIDKWTSEVQGVELIDKKGRKHSLYVTKEVILTAGAIGSPQILLNSGIGPKTDLEKIGLDVIKNLPVGYSLQNHVSVGIKLSIRDAFYQTLTLDSLNQFVANRTGPLSSTGLTQVTAFMESSFATPGIPDIQVFFDGFSSSCPKTGMSNECVDGNIGECTQRREIVMRPTALITESRGYLKLRSKNPLDHPLIYPNYFTHPKDIKVMVEGVKKAIKLTEMFSMKKWDLRLNETPHPMCSNYYFGSDAYWECFIRVQTGPENHQSGTCKMGSSRDPTTVVDHELKVHGIKKLRVADASVMPIVPNSNPTAAIVMISEKAAEMITRQHLYSSIAQQNKNKST